MKRKTNRGQVIFHSVAPSSNADEEIQYRINYQSTKQLLDIAGDHPSVRALIYTGSARSIASECHSRTTPLTEEEAVLHDLFSNGVPYERTKGAADALVRARSTGDTAKIALKGIDFHGSLSTAVIRVPALYGRRDLRTSGQMMKRANTRATCIQLGDNAAKHEWLYLDNAARAHVLAAKALLAGQEGVDGEAFFVTDGAPVNFWDFSRKLWAEAGDTSCSDPDSIRVIPMWLVLTLATISEWVFWILTLGTKKPSLSAHQLRYISRGTWWSIGKARERLGYEPLCGTDEGIRRTVEWFRHNKS